MPESACKPPVRGLKPKYIHDLERLREIQQALVRFYEAEQQIPVEWITEYNKLLEVTKEIRRNDKCVSI